MSDQGGTIVTVRRDTYEVVVERVFDAPRELVWQAWTTPEHLMQWWGPRGWTLPVCEVDLRPGGTWVYCMRGPDGENACGNALYREIVEPERLVYVDRFADENGNPVDTLPESVATVEFIEENGKTRVISRARFASAEALQAVVEMGMEPGIRDTFDRLAELVERR